MADNLLVNRDGQTYQVDMENTKSIQDTDLLLVNRNGTTYTVAGSEISRGDFSEVVIIPTSIVPEVSEQVLTAVSDIPKVGSDVPADVVWKWYQYDEATGTAGQIELQSKTNREASDTFILPASAASKFIGCSATYLAVTINETERCAVGVPPGPTAVMKGLRFDSARKTQLQRSLDTNPSQQWTLSYWIKPTYTPNTYNGVFSWDNDNRVVGFGDSNRHFIYDGTIRHFGNIVENEWQHICVTSDNGACKAYINGVEGLSASYDTNMDGSPITIGTNNSNPDSEYMNGYLSEMYFADGQILPPTTFAAQFPEGWGPLDNTVIETNLQNKIKPTEVIDPYDSRANTDQVWSNGVTSNANFFSGNPATAIFNGRDSGNGSAGETEGTGAATFIQVASLGFTGTTSLRLKGLWTQIEINGVTQNTGLVNNAYYTFDNVENLDTIKVYGSDADPASGPVLYQIEVDGRVLVDQDVWNNSQNWSDSCALTNGGTGVGGGTFATMFDGDLTQGINASAGTDTFTFDIGQANKLTGAVRFYISAGTAFTGDWLKVNGQLQTLLGGSLPGWITVDGVNELWSFSASNIGPGNVYGAIAAVEVDGKLLIDSGAQWDTSQIWSENLSSPGPGGVILPERAFDGIVSDANYAYNGTAGESLIWIPTGISAGSHTYEVYFDSGSTLTLAYTVGGVETVVGDSTVSNSFTASDVQSIRVTGTASGPIISAIKVDGKVLVDGAPTWNTSKIWTTECVGPQDRAKLAFDGDKDYQGYGYGNDEIAWIPTGGLAFQTMRVYGRAEGGNPQGIKYTLEGQSEVSFNLTNNSVWLTIPGPGTLTKLRWTRPGNSGVTAFVGAIEVDGEILVDGVNFGPNGFYLPFDSDKATIETYYDGRDASPFVDNVYNIFNGNYPPTHEAIYADQFVNSTDDNYTYFFTQPLTGVFEVRISQKDPGDTEFGWNGDCRFKDADGNILGYAENTQANGGMPTDPKWVSAGYLENVDSFQLARSGQASSNVSVSGIKLNGRVLSQVYRPGRDESGWGNDFVDQNINVLPYVPGFNVKEWVDPISQWTWVKQTVVQNPEDIQNREALFDGTTAASPTAANGNPGYIRYTPSSPITGAQIEIYVNAYSDSFANRDVRYKGVGQGERSCVSEFGSASPQWRDISTDVAAGLEYIEWGNYGGSDSNRPPSGLYAIRVNGKILTETGSEIVPPPDTVLDSPISSYAIIDNSISSFNSSNGNLYANVTQGGGVQPNIQLEIGKKYYFETYPDKGYNKGAGLQQKDGFNNPGAGSYSDFYGIFGYIQGGNFYEYNNGTETEIPNTPSADVKTIGIAIDLSSNPKTLQAYADGALIHTMNITTDDAKPYRFASISGNAPGTYFSVNYGQLPWVHTPPAGYTALYQSWSQWVIQTLVTKSAEADALKVMLLDHAQTYQASEDYCEGSVIKAFGELWIAVNQAPATTFADLAAITSHANWERLNISAN